MAELITWLFTSRLANLKLLQLLCAFLTILFLIDGQMQWKAYSIIFISVIILAIVTAITLVFYFLRLQSQVQLPWVSVELLFNAIAAILCFVFVAILVYDFVKMAGDEFHHHRHSPPKTMGDSFEQLEGFIKPAEPQSSAAMS